ncbi:MAG: hypothetical protein SFV22_15900, partial [Saprospiraceae bacterium]|nr:hypothetical protein [Saprospiraceae bacterium]
SFMQFLKTIITLFVLSFFVSPVFSQPPCLGVNGDLFAPCPGDAGYETTVLSLSGNRVSFSVNDAAGTLERNPGARYKAFWVLGDGNFRYFPYGTEAQDLSTYQLDYAYRSAMPHQPLVVLSERKSNTSPPRNLARTFNITGAGTMVAPGLADSFFHRLGGYRTLDIFNHDRNRPEYPTVFALSAPAADQLLDSVFFFYNGEKKADGTYAAKKLHDFGFVNFPNYFQPLPATTEMRISNGLPACLNVPALSSILTGRFLNYIGVRVRLGTTNSDRVKNQRAAAVGPIPRNLFPETRFFPALNSIWEERWISNGDTLLPLGHYLAVSVGSQPLPRIPNDKFPDEINPIYVQALRYFPELDPNTLQIGEGKFIRGIATSEVEMVASIDPNGLKVLQVCPTGQNRYEVKIRMEVCNEGYMHEKNFTFSLIDHTNGAIERPEFTVGGDKVHYNTFDATTHTWNYNWDVFLDGVPLPEASAAEIAEAGNTCDTLIFTVVTNWVGVQKLARGEGLELCVKFTHAPNECTLNYKLDEPVSPLVGYACGDMNAAGWNCCVPVYVTMVIVILILLLLIWLAWKLRRHFA